ncbi:hypothetical protein L596_017232 [Steinernema carpocapsae]|uniref:Uncharacterized protein n=1 Tax=Steinernema carpocapsae TaxID=34508 RepID=A0A4U5N1Q6_STECR|nr:hypothetical protein L596_017232 [Steinernema carpocapsae]
MTQTLLGILFSLLNVYYCYIAINDVKMKGTGCTIYGFLSGTLSLMSVYQPALMALEWCVIVIQPFMAKCITCTNRVVAVCGSAITILAVTIPPLFGIPSKYGSFDHFDSCWCPIIVLVAICNCNIYYKFCRTSKPTTLHGVSRTFCQILCGVVTNGAVLERSTIYKNVPLFSRKEPCNELFILLES